MCILSCILYAFHVTPLGHKGHTVPLVSVSRFLLSMFSKSRMCTRIRIVILYPCKSTDDFISSYDSGEVVVVRAGTVACNHLQQKTLP